MSVIIRKARRSDLQAVVSLWRIFTKYLREIGSRTPVLRPHVRMRRDAPKEFARWARKQIGSKNGVVFLAESEGKPVGYCLIFIRTLPSMSMIGKIACIGDLFVLEELRGQGISTMLKDEAVGWLRRKGIRHVTLFVLERNRIPQAIYKKWGFVPFVIEMRKNL